MANPKLIRVVDFETTGFPPKAGIVEIGITDVIVDGDSITINKPWATLCDPGMPIHPGAMGVHHITEEMIENQPDPDEIIAKHVDTPNVDIFAAHYAQFEQNFFKPQKPFICTMKIARIGNPDAPDHKCQTLRYYLGIDSDDGFLIDDAMPAHRAGPDTYVTAHLLKRMLIALHGDVDRLVKISTQPALLKVVPFGKHRGKKWSEMDEGYLDWVINNPKAEPDVKFTAQYYRNRR